MFLRVNKLLCLTFLLFAVSAANASPTGACGDAILTTGLGPADTPTAISCTINNVVGPINAMLADLGKEFLQPPASSAGLSNTTVNLVKPLPAVPGALFMVLTGFLCVSLVRDRRVWLAALAGLLWAGQTSIQALPQFALRLSHRDHSKQQLYAELTYPYYLENSHRLRCDIEGTRYIGLLRHLAGIPQGTMSFLSPSAITPERYSLNSLLNCLTLRVEQFIYFSPAFIFQAIPRGPPLLA